jgi:hypothetical protein
MTEGIFPAPGWPGTFEYRAHFEEFVRVQIGSSSQQGYKNWYVLPEVYKWKNVTVYQHNGTMYTHVSTVQEPNNDDW